MAVIREDFKVALTPPLICYTQGVGRIEAKPNGIWLISENTTERQYSNAQIDDYHQRKGAPFTWRPPLRMTVAAQFSHRAEDLRGTAGFGFWTQPTLPGRRLPFMPQSAWFFFGSRPSNMPFAYGVPGYGWKAATLDTTRLPFLLLAPTSPVSVLLMRVPALYRVLYPTGQRAAGISEKIIETDMRDPHTYRLDWLRDTVRFYVDDQLIHAAPYAPRGPLGFVAWLDNRYAVVTPQAQIAAGTLATADRQWMRMESLAIEPL